MEKIPSDLRNVFTLNPKAHLQWKDLTPIARRDFISWIESAKQPATRLRRLESIPDRLASGKKRPCCYAIVPMDLYAALGTNTKAKATWKTLTPDLRRDFSDWIESAKDVKTRKLRTEKACALLALGKTHP